VLTQLPNLLTLSRIAAIPVVVCLMLFVEAPYGNWWAFGVYCYASITDFFDGYLARAWEQQSSLGRFLDPIADKLLLTVTLIPIYLISHRGGPLDELPWIGPLPLWVLFVIFGRELFITIFRAYAARQGVVIAAGWSGKRKAMFQMFFTGAVLLWYPLVDVGLEKGWENWLWDLGSVGLQAWVPIMLGFALLLTVYSMIDYLWSYRVVVGIRD